MDPLGLFPQTTVCTSALAHARAALPEPILNHSLRVFLIARWLWQQGPVDDWPNKGDRMDQLFVASVCHDLGVGAGHDGPARFEVRGADVAAEHLAAHGGAAPDCHDVWVAVAVHTTSGIAERIHPLARLVRRAVLIDFGDAERRRVEADGCPCAEYEAALPRLAVEKCLGDAVVAQAGPTDELPRIDSLTWPDTEKHPSASWPGVLLRAHLENPHHEGVNPAF